MLDMSLTFAVLQLPIGWLNAVASWNMPDISVIFLVSHPEMSWLNLVAPLNIFRVDTTTGGIFAGTEVRLVKPENETDVDVCRKFLSFPSEAVPHRVTPVKTPPFTPLGLMLWNFPEMIWIV